MPFAPHLNGSRSSVLGVVVGAGGHLAAQGPPGLLGGATVRADWLARRAESILEPELPIIDPHHHLWIRPGSRYLADDLADMNSGHNIVATVYVQAQSMYRQSGPSEMRPVGETEFVNGMAAMFASGAMGRSRACAGIVGRADLTLPVHEHRDRRWSRFERDVDQESAGFGMRALKSPTRLG
jgi:hypothetical protein